ncbi:MAG: hypothetical protein A2511_14860 [Deltaproteobacteria bacterium RIFOXYD12_FULL_50_9]|nr:MAG: hypothetical protein A2511_14860 [Deltaproteobacteria bacterium RIFOXYD12_FULL_50_9]
MSNEPKPATPVVKLTPNELKMRLQGKIAGIDQFDGQNGTIHETLIVLPSVDEYSSPSRFAVKSERKIGKPGESIDVTVFVKSRYWKSQSGKVNHTPDLWLDDAA